jgi:hypothetical protein
LNQTTRVALAALPKEVREIHFRAGLHRRMNEKLNAVVSPHSPFPFPHVRNEEQLEVDPVGINAIVDAIVGFDPIAIDITGIWLLRTKAPVDVDLLNSRRAECFNSHAEPI